MLSAGRYRRLKNVVVVMDVLPDRQHLQEASGWGTGGEAEGKQQKLSAEQAARVKQAGS